jgi:DNA (cytosine-5)-methyltransferase 1
VGESQIVENLADVGSLVRRIRAERGLTQEGLARELGVSFATVNGWENGRHRPIPSLARLLTGLVVEQTEPAEIGPQGEAATTRPSADELTSSSGWPADARGRRDVLHRPREFPPDVARWRAGLVERALVDAEVFPRAVRAGREVLDGASKVTGHQAAVERVRELVDDAIAYLREVARILAVIHGTPRLGNKSDPVDELVYIVLSRKTREGAYQQAFSALKTRFPRWDDLLGASRSEVESLLSSSGLGEKKTASLFGALGAISRRFGSCTLEPVRTWSDAELESFLCSLPELHRKSAYCIMMYAFGRQVFPVDTHVGRVLSRLEPFRELGLVLGGMDHKQLQSVLADLAPPNLRYSLHVNLVSHGREICRAQKPLCSECDLRGFCHTYRTAESSRVQALGRPRIGDLFTGAGGLSEGFERAGFDVAFALDMDPVALKTYRLNHPAIPDDHVVCGDIRAVESGGFRRLAGRKRLDILVGAPPCQGFSHVGHRSKMTLTGYTLAGDARNYLYEDFVRAALELRPRLLLMENVPGMSSAKKGALSFIDACATALGSHGYRTAVWRLNALSFGVPQDRVRCFLVAAKDGPLPLQPAEIYQDPRAKDFDSAALPPVTFDEATFDLPARAAGEGQAVSAWPPRGDVVGGRYRRYLSKFGMLSRSRLIFNHTVRYHNERDLELYALLQPGEDSIHALERYNRADLMRYRSDVFDDKYARLRGDRACKTIVSHLAKDGNGYIHPSQVRSISLREAARIQSFRDDYVFCGSGSDQWVQVGNAVPPVMAEAIARSFMAALGEKA